MPKPVLLTAATTAILFTAGGALAQSSMSASFSQLDTNNDGQISRAEWNDRYHAGASSAGGTARGASASHAPGLDEPPQGGPRIVDDLGTAARGPAGDTAGGASPRQGGAPSSENVPRSGSAAGGGTARGASASHPPGLDEPPQGGPRVVDDLGTARGAAGDTTGGATPYKGGAPSSENAPPSETR